MTLRDRPDLDPMVQNQAKISAKAAEHGWSVTSENPLVLTKGDKQIVVSFNSAGMPNGAQWTHGDEFSDMGASGYLDLNVVFSQWMTWEDNAQTPEEDKG